MLHAGFSKKLLDILVYAVLVVMSYILMKGVCQEYLEAKTAFHQSKVSLGVEDNPAVLLLFDAKRGTDFEPGIDLNVTLWHWNQTLNDFYQDPNDKIVYLDRPGDRESGISSRKETESKNTIEIIKLKTIGIMVSWEKITGLYKCKKAKSIYYLQHNKQALKQVVDRAC